MSRVTEDAELAKITDELTRIERHGDDWGARSDALEACTHGHRLLRLLRDRREREALIVAASAESFDAVLGLITAMATDWEEDPSDANDTEDAATLKAIIRLAVAARAAATDEKKGEEVEHGAEAG